MTKEDALKIPSMRIEVTPFIEDCFFYALSQKGRLSKEQEKKSLNRVGEYSEKYNLETYYKGMLIAETMIRNIDQYGAACADWCE